MTFALFILYVGLAYVQPGEIVPALAPYRITYWVGMAGLVASGVSLLARGAIANLQLWMLLAFTAVTCLSLTVAEQWLGAPVLTLQRFGPSLTTCVLAMCSVTSLVRLRVAVGVVIALTIALTLQGASAYHLGYNARLFLMDRTTTSEEQGGASHEDEAGVAAVVDGEADPDAPGPAPRIRALGFMNDPNDLAMAMIVALGLIGGIWRPGLNLRHLLLAAAAAGLVYGIFLTRSRGGAVALVVVLWRFAAGRVGRLPALVVLLALGSAVMALDFGGRSLSAEDASASGRLEAWTEGFEMLKTQPVLGVGYGQFLDYHTLTAHNSLVLCLAETGLLGTFFWAGLFVVAFLELHGLKQLSGGEPFDDAARQWAGALQLSLIGFMAAAFFLSRTFAPTLYLIVGLSAATAAIARDMDRPIPLPPLPVLGMLVLGCELAGIAVVYAVVKLHVA
jgi:putative inorganic carbon (hco3(-)) transporter